MIANRVESLPRFLRHEKAVVGSAPTFFRANKQNLVILYNCFQKGLTRADIHPSGVLAVLTDVDPSVSGFRLNHRKHRKQITFHFEFLLLK